MFALISKTRRHNLPIDIQLQLFDSTVLPIMLYGCEVWGNSGTIPLDNLYIKYLKMILRVHGKTCNNMVYGELGRFPLKIYMKKRAIGFWARMIAGKESKLTRIIYTHSKNLHTSNVHMCKWIDYIKGILQECDLHNIWESHNFQSVGWLKTAVERKLKNNFIIKWKQELERMPSCDVYVDFKQTFKLEEYLIYLPLTLRRSVCSLRTNNSRIAKVLGRYTKVLGKYTKIPRELRYCKICPNGNYFGDEYHLLLECKNPVVISHRTKYISELYTRHPSMQNCINLIGSEDKSEIRKLAFFLKHTLPLFK